MCSLRSALAVVVLLVLFPPARGQNQELGKQAGSIPQPVLPIDPPKREGLIPDIKLGAGARLKLYHRNQRFAATPILTVNRVPDFCQTLASSLRLLESKSGEEG